MTLEEPFYKVFIKLTREKPKYLLILSLERYYKIAVTRRADQPKFRIKIYCRSGHLIKILLFLWSCHCLVCHPFSFFPFYMFNSDLNPILHSVSYQEPKSYKLQIPWSLDPSDISVMAIDASHRDLQLRPAPEQISAETQHRFTLHFLLLQKLGYNPALRAGLGPSVTARVFCCPWSPWASHPGVEPAVQRWTLSLGRQQPPTSTATHACQSCTQSPARMTAQGSGPLSRLDLIQASTHTWGLSGSGSEGCRNE